MASTAFPSGAAWREGLAKRAALVRSTPPAGEHGPPRKLLLGELLTLAQPVRRLFAKPLLLPRAARPRVVMLLPGFGNHPLRMRYMARRLEAAGHTVKRWGLGINLGPSEEILTALERRVDELHARYEELVVLVGWSLGGIFAREIAKRNPQSIAKVISMGSPFSGSAYANNVWRVYQLVTGHAVNNPPIEADLAAKPPVETVALWSARDGIIAPRCARGRAGERDRAVALRCTHLGFAHSDEAIAAVARELERI